MPSLRPRERTSVGKTESVRRPTGQPHEPIETLADDELAAELTIAVYEPERRAHRYEQLLHERLLRRARKRFSAFQIPR